MEKEIVICAFNEITDWIPTHWRPYSIVYVCGQQSVSIRDIKDKHKDRPRPYGNLHIHDPNSFVIQVENLNLLLDLVIKTQKMCAPQVIESSEGRRNAGGIKFPYASASGANCPHLRESEQWLNHIIWRYDILADVTVFLQGNPFDHCPDIINLVDQIGLVDFATLPPRPAGPAESGADLKLVLTTYNLLFNTQHTTEAPPIIRWAAGAQFTASSKIIRSKPRGFYVSLQEKMRAIPRSGEIMERIWWNILGCPQ